VLLQVRESGSAVKFDEASEDLATLEENDTGWE
jgi:hypothetical protein